MRLAKKEKRKILVPNSVHTRSGKENSKKNRKKNEKIKKPLPGIIFSQNGDVIGGESEKKILVPNFGHTRPGQENCKKYHKIKKHTFDIFLAKTG